MDDSLTYHQLIASLQPRGNASVSPSASPSTVACVPVDLCLVVCAHVLSLALVRPLGLNCHEQLIRSL